MKKATEAAPQLLAGTVYEIVVVPALTPIINPPPGESATAELLLAHTPPLVPVENNWVAVFGHIAEVPIIVPAEVPALTVIVVDVKSKPQLFETK